MRNSSSSWFSLLFAISQWHYFSKLSGFKLALCKGGAQFGRLAIRVCPRGRGESVCIAPLPIAALAAMHVFVHDTLVGPCVSFGMISGVLLPHPHVWTFVRPLTCVTELFTKGLYQFTLHLQRREALLKYKGNAFQSSYKSLARTRGHTVRVSRNK